jgi:quercetin dioxygenase-like cupin family protein
MSHVSAMRRRAELRWTLSGNAHFSLEASGEPTSAGRFVGPHDVAPVEFIDGLQFRPVIGERMLANYVLFDRNSTAPRHVHEEEQIVIVLDGEFEFEIDGEVRIMRHGDIAVIPAWVPHRAQTYDTTCLEVDVFNPPRKTLVDHAVAQRDAGQAAARGGAGQAAAAAAAPVPTAEDRSAVAGP